MHMACAPSIYFSHALVVRTLTIVGAISATPGRTCSIDCRSLSLLSMDDKLAAAPGHRASIELIAA